MAGKQLPGDGLTASMAGMSKNQLYEIMSQMKALIEQNQQQAKEILIENPKLTKALFQAQIMLGMVQPPKVIPSIQPAASQQPQQTQQPDTQASQSLPGQGKLQDPADVSQTAPSVRKQPHNQPSLPISSASLSSVNLQSQSMPSHPLQIPQQPMGHPNPQGIPATLPQSSQLSNVLPRPFHSASQPPPIHQSQIPTASSQLQQPQQTTGVPLMPLQPPMPPQPRPSVPPFHHHYPQVGPHFQHSGAQHLSQPMYHSGSKPPPNVGPSFAQGQPPLPSQRPPQMLYQGGGSHLGSDYNQVGSSLQVDRGSSWPPASSENPTAAQPSGQLPLIPGQMGPGNQAARPPPLTPDMEKQLLQQVMSLTPEQINLLPPEQRNQVLQLQQMLLQ